MSEDKESDGVYERWLKGGLEWHINKGIIVTRVITYCNVYHCYKTLRDKDPGLTYLRAVEQTAELMNTSTDTVKRAVAELV